uniref:VQ domain-containing protein n=1 Tax=Cannabis sativa TaxID=3483 RepID=A0A803QLJ0_CANSA
MGKRVSQSTSVKTTKNNEKKDLNSWIKVLKPKVYITDSSNFKQLVQQLTGNGNNQPFTKPQQEIKNVPVIEIDEDDHQEIEPEISVEVASLSFDGATDSSELFYSNQLEQEFSQVYNNEIFLDDDNTNLENYSVANQQVDLLAYWDIEKWLLDYDSHGLLYNNVYGPIEQDVSIYDYELSGII